MRYRGTVVSEEFASESEEGRRRIEELMRNRERFVCWHLAWHTHWVRKNVDGEKSS